MFTPTQEEIGKMKAKEEIELAMAKYGKGRLRSVRWWALKYGETSAQNVSRMVSPPGTH